jgi:hypothetical protein
MSSTLLVLVVIVLLLVFVEEPKQRGTAPARVSTQ